MENYASEDSQLFQGDQQLQHDELQVDHSKLGNFNGYSHTQSNVVWALSNGINRHVLRLSY